MFSAIDRDETERLFSSSGVVTALIALFRDKKLHNRRVITTKGSPAPIALTSVVAEPYGRRVLDGYARRQGAIRSDPDPRVRVTLGFDWPKVPFRVFDKTTVEVPAELFEQNPLDAVYPYQFVYGGLTLDVLGAKKNEKGSRLRLLLSAPIEIQPGLEGVASIHGGATRIAIQVEAVSATEKSGTTTGLRPSAFESGTAAGGAGAPVYAAEISGVWSDHISVYLVASNRGGQTTLRLPVRTTVKRPSPPLSLALERRTSVPDAPLLGGSIVRADARAVCVLQIQKTPGAAILGLVVKPVAPPSDEKSLALEPAERYVALSPDDVRWQLATLAPVDPAPQIGPEIDVTTPQPSKLAFVPPPEATRTVEVDLGSTNTSSKQQFLVSTVDELARRGPEQLLNLSSAASVYVPSEDLGEAFGRVTQLAISPLAVDIESVAARFVQTAETLVRSAETRLESSVKGQQPVRQATTP